MICNVAGVLIFLSVCGVVASSPDRAIDCRKFVFAPLCRGVAAKRGSVVNGRTEPAIYIEEKSFKDLLKNLYTEMGIPGAEDDDPGKQPNQQEELEYPMRKYQHERDNRFYRLLLGNKRSNSETDNVPGHEYENL